MAKFLKIKLVFSLLVLNIVFAQNSINDFKIGVFGATSCKTQKLNGCDVPYESPIINGYKTSVLNVLSEDGFNIYQTYHPNEWTSENFLKGYLKLSQANNFKVELGTSYYKASVDNNNNYLGYGTNVYDNCGNSIGPCQNPYSQNYFLPHTNNFINNIYKLSPYKDIIWGYHISEEAAYYHLSLFTNNCQGNAWGNPLFFTNVETPPTNVNSALHYFKNTLNSMGITNHKMIIMEANHQKNINPNTTDDNGIYNPQQYLQLLNKNDSRDVFFEGSYTQFPSSDWVNQKYSNMSTNGVHYLGSFKSIDYSKNYASEIHKALNIEGTTVGSNYLTHYHSNTSIPNANWLCFQAYTSIIHGASGVWFWDINHSWNIGEINNWGNSTLENRYDRSFFPTNYKNYTSYLSKELRYLFNKNILSTDKNSVIATKTDIADPFCIVPPAITYIPSYLPTEKRNENYGLRYTIRTNGSETYMIISNPLNIPITTTLNFANTSNQIIQNATGVNVLFDNGQSSVSSNSYKINRNSNINLTTNTLNNQYFIPFSSNKAIGISFGPMDVKVLKFVSNVPNYNNGWDMVWSNNGSGHIDGHTISSNDLFHIGDFDGDGIEELICITNVPNSSNNWITMLKFQNNSWQWMWSNYGVSNTGNGIYDYRNNLIVGDFDGDGKDELLGNNPNGWTTLFKFQNNNWQWTWSDYGNNTNSIRPYKDKFHVGDFDGDGKDELLGCDLPNGWTTLFKFQNNNWQWTWSDYGNNTNSIRPYRSNMLVGDFNGDNKDELLGFDGWSTVFKFENNNWQWGWSNYGSNSFSGWSYPLLQTDKVLVGNLDFDTKDELFFLQTDNNASWATTMDLKNDQSGWNWNWSANPQYAVPFIDNWSLSPLNGSETRYFLIKSKINEPKKLLAMRKYCNSYLVNMYKTNSTNNYKYANKEEEGIKEEIIESKIFPNPSNGYFTITSNKEISNIKIFNSLGLPISNNDYKSTRELELNLLAYLDGFYFIKITNMDQSVSTHKISITK